MQRQSHDGINNSMGSAQLCFLRHNLFGYETLELVNAKALSVLFLSDGFQAFAMLSISGVRDVVAAASA